ncbi:tRNA:m(4)X modification enzyme TRM13 [Apophysomyces sp. BC1034]|nr:tRNA:m(4)X modification enzyme TRM13 [Apophysomyces sp. BC1015]KAG0182271.1 tRNA:m(4)X modification enzyme TRM13 [Apophysomyces sp. BC1021]KAG0192890.1 tRNA:m(4)X modification enzyme TRM13 [Apophysomyces sp. BC1034]
MPKEKTKLKANATPQPPPPNKPQQCHFWVARKRRYCSLPAKRTNRYCGEHLTEQQTQGEVGDSLRVPCPYDPSHTVFAKDLETHMQTRCNSRPKGPESYHSLNINCTLPLSKEELEFQQTQHSHKHMRSQPWIARVQLHELPTHELNELITKIQGAYEQQVPDIKLEILTHETTQTARQAAKFRKHLDQQSSLIGHMAHSGMLKDKQACFIEFGAGKGELSNHLKIALAEKNGEATYVLIDRKNVRKKFDTVLQGQSSTRSTVQRILGDIKDLDLAKVEALLDENKNKKKVIALSKHLCGSATDITLKCLMNYVEKEKKAGNSSPISGIIIALCCHQLCRYEMYPNTKYLNDIGLTKTDFDRLCKMSSWAICSRRQPETEATETIRGGASTNQLGTESDEEDLDEHAHIVEEVGDADETTGHYSGRDHHDREKIGYQCKRVLDAGRVKYLQEHGFKVELLYYVDPSTSLENCALIALPI